MDPKITIDFWSLALLVGIMLGLLVIPYLIRIRKLSGHLLAALMMILVLNLANYLFINTHLYRLFPYFVGVPQPLLFLIGPIYFFYIRSLLEPGFRIGIHHWPHFILFGIAAYYHADMMFMTSAHKIQALDYYMSLLFIQPPLEMVIYILVHGLQTLIYILMSQKSLRESSLKPLSYKDTHTFIGWVKTTNFVFGSFWILILTWAGYLFFATQYYHEADYLVMLFMAAVVSLPAICLIYYQGHFKQYLLALYEHKYQSSSLSDEHAAAILKKLLILMEKEKPYLDTQLKIADLAIMLSVSTNLLSQVINQELNKNFFEFINEYRISEAMNRLRDPQHAHLTILGIANEVGFNNKNTFNRHFKQQTGLTPSQFLRSHSA